MPVNLRNCRYILESLGAFQILLTHFRKGAILADDRKGCQNKSRVHGSKITTPPELYIHDSKSYQMTNKFIEWRIKKFTTRYYLQLPIV